MSAHHTFIDTDLGRLTLTAEDGTLTGVYFPHHWRQPTPERLGDEGFDPVFAKTEAQLTEYLAGDRQSFDLPLTLHGDDFQRRVWKLLEEIPYGATTTYGELADRLGNKALAQTVGKAVGDNPVSIVVPCHRVVGSDGKLTGYAGGLERKRALLDLEEPRDTRLF
jgi:methylated-DNA-[protein]-cysteine S-methyltransferase